MNILIDADSYIYQIAYHCQDLQKYQLKDRLVSFMNKRLNELKMYGMTGNNYLLLLSDKHTFRYDIYPEYKANRKKTKPLLYIAELYILLKEYYKYKLIKNYEADDLAATYMKLSNYNDIIVHIDKDLLQIPGNHIYKNKLINISEINAFKYLIYQIIQGDNTDNIKGLKGYGKVKAKDIILNNKASDLIDIVINLFIEQEQYKTQGLIEFWKNYNLIKLKSNININDK